MVVANLRLFYCIPQIHNIKQNKFHVNQIKMVLGQSCDFLETSVLMRQSSTNCFSVPSFASSSTSVTLHTYVDYILSIENITIT